MHSRYWYSSRWGGTVGENDAQIAVMFLMILCTYVGEKNCYEMYCTSFDVDA
jgi:hypothetical protein